MGISDLFRLFKRRKDEQKIKNYIFQGGGTKGVAYIGALQELEKNGIKLENIKKIGGTSVGAITAALLSVGYDLVKLNEELKDMDFESFIDIENENVEKKISKYYNPEFISEFMTKTTEYVKTRIEGQMNCKRKFEFVLQMVKKKLMSHNKRIETLLFSSIKPIDLS